MCRDAASSSGIISIYGDHTDLPYLGRERENKNWPLKKNTPKTTKPTNQPAKQKKPTPQKSKKETKQKNHPQKKSLKKSTSPSKTEVSDNFAFPLKI